MDTACLNVYKCSTATIVYFSVVLKCPSRIAPSGMTHLMEQMAWKTTIHRTHFRIVREVCGILWPFSIALFFFPARCVQL